MPICCVILAGGPQKGTRLRPLSLEVPKPLLLIAGKTVLEHMIEAVAKVGKINKIIIVGNYDNLNRTFNFENSDRTDLEIKYVNEGILHGTAGSILYLYRAKELEGFEQILIMNCDVVCDYPVFALVQYHNLNKKLCSIMGIDAPRDVSTHFGCIVKEDDNDLVTYYIEKPNSYINNVINGGLAVIHRDEKVLNLNKNCEILDLGRHLYPSLAEQHNMNCFLFVDSWCTVKSPSCALHANKLLLSLLGGSSSPSCKYIENVYIHPSATVHPSCLIGPNVSIGPDCIVEEGVRISESILLQHVLVKKNTCIRDSILCDDCVVESWCRIEGKNFKVFFDYYKKSREKYSHFTKDGKIAPSVSVLGSNVHMNQLMIAYNSIVLPHKEISYDATNEIIL